MFKAGGAQPLVVTTYEMSRKKSARVILDEYLSGALFERSEFAEGRLIEHPKLPLQIFLGESN